ncbi:nuclear transport factor 2 family protein [Dokdonia sp.]|uniref:YybH family protein n=1 Tax=Dokdonia sp. TaxID=2024995 RepID=UPI003264249B
MKRKAMRPRDIATEISRCIQDGDLENILDFFHPEYTMAFPPTEAPKRGMETLREVFGVFITSKAVLTSQISGEMINGDIGVLQGNWHVKDPSGTILGEGNSIEVVKQREDGSWVYFIDCPLGLPLD